MIRQRMITQPGTMLSTTPHAGTRAFSIEEHELALRWADLARPPGSRVSVALDVQGAEELLLVYRPGRQAPAFALQALHSTIVLIDCLGMTMRFSTLAGALMAMSPMPGPSKHELLHGGRRTCLLELPGFLTTRRRGLGHRIISAVCQIASRLR
jgi:hypothetical protein